MFGRISRMPATLRLTGKTTADTVVLRRFCRVTVSFSGTFTYRLKGFTEQPTNHFASTFFKVFLFSFWALYSKNRSFRLTKMRAITIVRGRNPCIRWAVFSGVLNGFGRENLDFVDLGLVPLFAGVYAGLRGFAALFADAFEHVFARFDQSGTVFVIFRGMVPGELGTRGILQYLARNFNCSSICSEILL